ncbi:MAG: peptidoglycan DD-metalloendopeptidase family protein [Planctomycetes bacterium]|nr:peptidoglycan DD-metalloendopeptidase family protein [Planctomycetota bacterium]
MRHTLILVLTLFGIGTPVHADDVFKTPLFQVVDLNVGDLVDVNLSDGSISKVKVVDLAETRDSVCFAVRQAVVTVEINGQTTRVTSGTYNLPQTVGAVQVDCPVTRGYNKNGSPEFWGLDKDVRLRLWPAGSPYLRPGTFVYPVKQKWFATDTQMANEPVHVDGGDKPGERKIYYHSGLDLGGSEGLIEVVAATDALIVSVGDQVLEGHRKGTPVAPRYDVVYLRDDRGWYYRYSHLKSFDPQIVPGRILKLGDRVGWLGKEGGSGGWSHLHFEIMSRQPSGKWGTQEGYPFLWEAYRRQYAPKLIAVARPHHLAWTGEEITLSGAKSWSEAPGELTCEWQLSDGSRATGPEVKRTYSQAGRYSEVLRVTDTAGHVAYDFAVVLIVDREHPERQVPSIHPNYFPTQGIRPADPVTFKVRTFNTTAVAKETWDFGDGSQPVEVQSDGNAVKLAPGGYAVTTHRFEQPGDYIVRVSRTNESGYTATGHLHVHVEGNLTAAVTTGPWERIAMYFTPPAKFAGDRGTYKSPLQFQDGTIARTPDDWKRRRSEILKQWTGLLGEWPALIDKPKVEVLESTRRDNFTQHKVRFEWIPNQLTTGYLLIPDGEGKRPAVVTVYYEPETAIGNGGEFRDFAYQLARRGFVTLSIGTTETTENKTYSLYYPDIDTAQVQPLSMLGCAAANAWHVLANRPEVDSRRIGIVGHSYGGKWAMFAGCLFDKFAAVAVSDPGIMFDTNPSVNYWEPWYLGWHKRPWRERGVPNAQNPARGLYPKLLEQGRDLHELQSLLAPRPFLVSGGAVDPPERWRALNHLVEINRLLGFDGRVGMTNRPDHTPNAESNEVIYEFFGHYLR